MTPQDVGKKLKSPNKHSASWSPEPETMPQLSEDCQLPTESSLMEEMSFPASPFMEFEAFSALNPSVLDRVVKSEEMETDSSIGVPQPLECLQGIPIPPFISKTFDLVDDRNLDPIISWGANGDRFVVWDPVAFSRSVLPRYFKHNNFSSFVRQLNTYGFRKVNADRWEFANEAFRRGERHLLRNIQRRKTPRSKQIGIYTGSYSESGSAGLEIEVDRLRKDRSIMMNEVAELQKQQCGTVHHMEAIIQRLQETEQKLMQMISFLGKLFQNPQFLALLKNKKEQGEIRSSKMKRKFVRHHISEPDQSKLCMEGQIANYKHDWTDLTLPTAPPPTNPIPMEQPDHTLHGILEMGLHVEDLPFPTENVVSREYTISDESAMSQGFAKQRECSCIVCLSAWIFKMQD
ncbi:hypothetical protein K2173_018608 [Erythroxylum novogranatense]|uniref:HSF-type DNA-binding domain-containing protein n=1 Tax=Erythroxylum novogranatense TaxID=1862640 RepID=A0AAV8UC98_9ROSI|nr:hypothetical protein K2173_018608 [Erythroxylum novogranatense]